MIVYVAEATLLAEYPVGTAIDWMVSVESTLIGKVCKIELTVGVVPSRESASGRCECRCWRNTQGLDCYCDIR